MKKKKLKSENFMVLTIVYFMWVMLYRQQVFILLDSDSNFMRIKVLRMALEI